MLRACLVFLVLGVSGCYLDPYAPAPKPGPTDWYQAGWDDAMAGDPIRSDLVLAHVHNDDEVDRQEWLRGYAKGQQRICDPDFLKVQGSTGKSFPQSCEKLPDTEALRATWQTATDAGIKASRLN